MIGPMDFTINDESGVMIEGFEREPMIKQPWHPPYYQQRCEEAGLTKAMDLLMWELDISDRDHMLPIIFTLAEQIEERHGVVLRKMSRRSLRRDMDRFAEVYNEAWSENWGFSPYSKEDLDHYAQEMQLVFDPHWFMVAETKEGETVAVAITVPDLNQVLKKMNGRLLPLGWWHYLRRSKIIDRVRVGFLGVKPSFQHTGVAAALYVEHFNMATRHAADVGRDGLDPRDQQGHEPRDGGHARPDRAPLPGLRAGSVAFPVMDRTEQLKASPPLFDSPLLDRFTRVHPVVPVLIYAPGDPRAVRSPAASASGVASALGLALGGYAVWTLTEYWLHRVVFHFEPAARARRAAALDDPRRPPRPSRTTRCGS